MRGRHANSSSSASQRDWRAPQQAPRHQQQQQQSREYGRMSPPLSIPPRYQQQQAQYQTPYSQQQRHSQSVPQQNSTQQQNQQSRSSSSKRKYKNRSPQKQQQSGPQSVAALDLIEYDTVSHDEVRQLDISSSTLEDFLEPGKAICYLTNIITIAENQNRKVGGINFEAKAIGSNWVGYLTINFPTRRTFVCKNRNKKECKNICAMAAVYNLRKDNHIDSRLKLNVDTTTANSFIDNSRGPIYLSPLPMNIKQEMMSFIRKFDEYVANLLEFRIESAKARYERIDIGGLEGKHAAILEGLEPDEGVITTDMADKVDKTSTYSTKSSAPIDLFTSQVYSPPDTKSKYQAFTQLRNVLRAREQRYSADRSFYDLVQAQERLPIRSLKNTIIEKLADHRAIVVAGDTGCGKSTQVPQFILEDFASNDHNVNNFANVAITQPRRISAISLAERVSHELGEPGAGRTVGHNVRFDSRTPDRDLNIMTFFTTGMLLRKLQRNSDLKGVTHLVIDEVHERDCTTDFLLILIKRLLVRRPDLRVIFMSASMDAALFAKYFDNCPIVSVPGRCYPVQDIYLDEICREMRIKCPRDDGRELSRAPKLNINLLADLINYIDDTRQPGAVLCFMPGWKEMKSLQKELEMSRSRNKLKVLLAHSKLPISEQRLIFSRAGAGERKIILSTNIAETSLTVDDVCYVIDSGLSNSIDYDADFNMSTFGTRWISRANAKQRAGRAGRVCAGECFKLYTREEEMQFQEYPYPELLRIPLESVIMEAKSHCPEEKAVSFLSAAIQHPSISAIHNALEELNLLGVLDMKENLTVLGKRISDFPTHPRLSVSLVVAAALRCLYPILNTGAVLSSTQEPFLMALTDKSQIRATKERLCNEVVGSSRETINFMSDHVAFGNLLAQYDNAAMSKHELEFFLQDNNLNRSAMSNISECRNLYAKMMISSKFVTSYEWYSYDSMTNRNMNELELVIASLTYSFYPKLVRIIRGMMKNGRMYPNRCSATDVLTNNKVRFSSESIVRNISMGRQLSIRDDQAESDEDSDYISMSDGTEDRRPTFLIYLNSRLDQESGQVVVRDGSVVPALTLLLFGGRDMHIYESMKGNEPNANNIVNICLDRYGLLSFKVTRDDATVIQAWRDVWQRYFDWYIHTRNTGQPVDENDSIISKTMDDFLELNKKLYRSIR